MYNFINFTVQEKEYDTLDLIRDLHHHFISPMTTGDIILAFLLMFGTLVVLSYILYRGIRVIWGFDKKDKLL